MCEIYLVYSQDPDDGALTFGDAFFSRKLAESYVKEQEDKLKRFMDCRDKYNPPYEKEWHNPETWRPTLLDPQIKEITVCTE